MENCNAKNDETIKHINTMITNYKKKILVLTLYLLFNFCYISAQTYDYSYTIGTTGVSGTDNSHFNQPTDIDFDSSGNIYIGDNRNQRIQIYNSSGTYINTFNSGSGNLNFNFVDGVAIDASNNIYISNDNTQEIFKYNSSFNYVTEISHNGVIDLASNGSNIYASHFNTYTANTYNTSLSLTSSFGTGNPETSNAGFLFPLGIAVDASGNIYVVDVYNHRVQVISSAGAYITTIGVSGVSGSDNSHFQTPHSVAIDPTNGNILVADTLNYRIQIFDSSYNYITTIGGNGVGSANNQFNRVDYINVDSTGNIYISDRFNHRVQVFTKNTLGLEELNSKSEVLAFPNPTNDVLTINSKNEFEYIIIHNHLGQQVLKTKNQSQNNYTTINISSLKQGTYFAEVLTKNGISSFVKFVKI